MIDATRTDHAAAIHGICVSLVALTPWASAEAESIGEHADALAAERDALRTYALLLEGELYDRVPDANEIISACRDHAGVTAADLYETPPEGVQGGAM
jgi:hypothetical protein